MASRDSIRASGIVDQPHHSLSRFVASWGSRIFWLLVALYYAHVAGNLFHLVSQHGWNSVFTSASINQLLDLSTEPFGIPFGIFMLIVGFPMAAVLGYWSYVERPTGTVSENTYANRQPSPEVVSALENNLRSSSDMRVRVAAARALDQLGQLQGTESVQYLIGDLRDAAEPSVRAAAIHTLGDIRGEVPIALLRDKLFRDDAPEVRAAAATALGKIDGPEAVESLIVVARKDLDRRVQKAAAAAALLLLAEHSTLEVLVDGLRDEDPDVRALSAAALGPAIDRLPTLPAEIPLGATTTLADLQHVGAQMPISELVDALAQDFHDSDDPHLMRHVENA